MKKSLYLLAILGTVIAGCSEGLSTSSENQPSSYISASTSQTNNIPNADFSFSNLRLNLSSINQVGIYRNPSRPVGRKQSSEVVSTTQNDSYLVGYNAQGDTVPLLYSNSQNEQVQMPFSVLSLEVVGDFSYIVYYDSQAGNTKQYLESTLSHNSEYRQLGGTKFEVLLKSTGYFYHQAYIIMHNKTGKLFDALDTINLKDSLVDGQLTRHLQLFTPFYDKIIYFTRSNNTCKGELRFNEADNTLTKTEVCTSLEITPIFVHENGNFVYTFDSKTSYASADFSVTNDLSSYFDYPIARNMVFKSVGQNIVMLSDKSPSKFLVFDGNFSLKEEVSFQVELLVGLDSFTWRFNKGGFDYFSLINGGKSYIYIVDFENLTIEIVVEEITFNLHRFIDFENKIFQIGTSLRVLNENLTYSTLEEGVYEVTNEIWEIVSSGYVEYTQTQGLTQINKYLNLRTGEIYLESESRPTITVTQVQPIN
jgi:hypothetical protein